MYDRAFCEKNNYFLKESFIISVWQGPKNRSSRSRLFFKTGVLPNFANFTGKQLCRSLFLIKLQALRPATLLKRDSNTGVFLWICEIFKNTSFLQNTSGGCFCKYDLALNNNRLPRAVKAYISLQGLRGSPPIY